MILPPLRAGIREGKRIIVHSPPDSDGFSEAREACIFELYRDSPIDAMLDCRADFRGTIPASKYLVTVPDQRHPPLKRLGSAFFLIETDLASGK